MIQKIKEKVGFRTALFDTCTNACNKHFEPWDI